MTTDAQDATWDWGRLLAAYPLTVLRRALDLVALDRVDLDARGVHLAGRAGEFDVGVDARTGEAVACGCGRTPRCAHAAALLLAASGASFERAPAAVRDAPRAAFRPGEPPVPVAAFPETSRDLEIPGDALSEAQRAAVETLGGVTRRSAASYLLPREEAPALAAALDAAGTALAILPRRPFVRFRAVLPRADPARARLVCSETPGLAARTILERHGFVAQKKKARTLTHEYEGPAERLHLAAEEMAHSGGAVILAEGALPTFEPLAPVPPPRTRAPSMPVVLSRRRFDWWTPRVGLPPLATAILQRHGQSHEGGFRLSTEGLRNAERELTAAGLHAARVEEADPLPAVAKAAARDGECEVRVKGRAIPAPILAAFHAHGFVATAGGAETVLLGPSANLPSLAMGLALVGSHLTPGPEGWPALPEVATTTAPLFPDDPRVPLAREGALVVHGDLVTLHTSPAGSVLARNLRVALYRLGYLGADGAVRAPRDEAGRLVFVLREGGFDARFPKPVSGDWRLCTVRYHERPRREGGGTRLQLKGPIPLGRLGGADPAAETARIQALVGAMESTLRRLHPDAEPVAHGALPGTWSVAGGAGAFLLDSAARGASVVPGALVEPLALGKGVVLVDQACLPPRLVEFRRTVDPESGALRPVVSPEIEAVIRRVVPEGVETDERRGHYLVPSTRMGALVEALRTMGCKVLQRRLAPRGQRYQRWEPVLPEDETGARPRLREPWRGEPFDGEVPGLRPECILDPHQREGVAFILDREYKALLADEMGLGKTLTSIASAQFLPGKVLVVCPASARAVWSQEVRAWTTERARVLLPGDDPGASLRDVHEKYVVVAYSGLQRFAEALQKIPFDLVVLDESHYVKSRAAQRTKLVHEHLGRIPRRLILSGTPVMNEPQEIRTQLAFVHPEEWSDTAWFSRRFQRPWKHGTQEVKDAVLTRLREHMEGVMLRREKRQALPDLPEKRLHVRRLELPPDMRRAYDEQEDLFRDYMQEHEETALTGDLAATAGRLERLKQTALVGKLTLIIESVRLILDRGEKVVLFCHYREPIASLAKELGPYGVVTVTGSTSATERGAAVERFQKRDDVRVFIGQTVAAGVAVTLTAARHAVFCDLEWNPALHRQAMDRVHRKTQTRDVEVHFFLAQDTVEEDIAEVLEEKTRMMDMLLEGRSGGEMGLREKEVAQREVALRILSRKRRFAAGELDED